MCVRKRETERWRQRHLHQPELTHLRLTSELHHFSSSWQLIFYRWPQWRTRTPTSPDRWDQSQSVLLSPGAQPPSCQTDFGFLTQRNIVIYTSISLLQPRSRGHTSRQLVTTHSCIFWKYVWHGRPSGICDFYLVYMCVFLLPSVSKYLDCHVYARRMYKRVYVSALYVDE